MTSWIKKLGAWLLKEGLKKATKEVEKKTKPSSARTVAKKN